MHKACAGAVLSLLITSAAIADNWPQWRGPHGNGVADGKNYPVRWSSSENVAWKIALPGLGASTPAVWQDRIFVTCASQDGQNLLLCLDRNGRTRWQTRLGRERAGRNKKATGSNSSPTTDGKHVYVYFKSGDLACVDFSGKVVWQKNLQEMYGPDKLWWDLGTSPVLTKDFVVVTHMHEGPSYVVAFHKQTGNVAWRANRKVDAPSESNDSYTTPVVDSRGDAETIITLGGDHVIAHDARNGDELWRVGGLNPTGDPNFRSIASPVVSGDLVVAPYARGKTITTVRLGGRGDVTDSHVVWSKENVGADVPCPVADNGRVYVCGDTGLITCLDVQTGDRIWSQRVRASSSNRITSSPILADGRLYLTREDGTTFVLATDDLKLLAENELEGRQYVVATPVFTQGQILIRTPERLYCIGKE